MNTLLTGIKKSYGYLLVESKKNPNRIQIHVISATRDDNMSDKLSDLPPTRGIPKRRWAYRIEYTTPDKIEHDISYYIAYAPFNDPPDINLLEHLVGKDCLASRHYNGDIRHYALTYINEIQPKIIKNLVKVNFDSISSVIQQAKILWKHGRWNATDLYELENLNPSEGDWKWFELVVENGVKAVCGARLAPLSRGQVGNLLEIRYFAGETMKDCGDIVTRILHELSGRATKIYVVFQYYNPFEKLMDYIQQHNRGLQKTNAPVGPKKEIRNVLFKNTNI